MLTGCFPFRRQEDEGLDVQSVLQKMLPRILKADYQQPQVVMLLLSSHVVPNQHPAEMICMYVVNLLPAASALEGWLKAHKSARDVKACSACRLTGNCMTRLSSILDKPMPA